MEDSAIEKQALKIEKLKLERRLQDIRATLKLTSNASTGPSHDISKDEVNSSTDGAISDLTEDIKPDKTKSQSSHEVSLHALLLLSDSALPLGSFAFSNGLESYLAHHRTGSGNPNSKSSNSNKTAPASSVFHSFLHLSILNTASTTLPFLLATYRNPAGLEACDDGFDATLSCTVARRASVAQGRALVGVWEKSFTLAPAGPPPPPSPSPSPSPSPNSSMHQATFSSGVATANAALTALKALALRLRSVPAGGVSDGQTVPTTHAHFAPVFGVVAANLGIAEYEAAYVFLLSHAKAVLSAGVRAGVLGPFASQAVLAGQSVFIVKQNELGDGLEGSKGHVGLRELIEACIFRERNTSVEDAGITVPAIDLWQGRHELLYSRIFNS